MSEMSAIVKIGIQSNFAMLRAIYNTEHKSIAQKIIHILIQILNGLGPLSLKRSLTTMNMKHELKEFMDLLQMLSTNNDNIEVQYPLRALLSLSLAQATLSSCLQTINAMIRVMHINHQMSIECPSILSSLVAHAFPHMLQIPDVSSIVNEFTFNAENEQSSILLLIDILFYHA